MRRIFSVAIIALIAFLFAYGIVPSVKATVDGFILGTAGPAVFSGLVAAYNGIMATLGVGGFAALVLAFGFLTGVIMHWGWVKADWKIRRWGASRTVKDLGVTPVAPLRTTPAGATTRPTPAPTPQPSPTPAVEAPVTEEKTEESEAT